VFPDHYSANAVTWWKQQVGDMQNRIKFDGLWLDMNEASNMLCNGVCYKSQMAKSPLKYKLPYIPGNRDIEEQQISLDALHISDDKKTNITELDAHNMFGYRETLSTHQWFKENNKRTFIISRSTFAGQGGHSQLWLGDNWSTTEMMFYSIYGIMHMNIMGMPLAGADICGFLGDTNPLLCARWTVLGSFYPFSRNHNNYVQIDQEPYREMFDAEYEPGVTYKSILRTAIRNKYHLIQYYYSQLFMIS